jgi:pimeloyl-ACP methyl ester carboxylesterase
MSILEVPGAQLYYRTRGTGPLVIMIPGASGNADSFLMMAEHVPAHFTTITYDRRGFSRSPLDGPQDYNRRLETDADDVRRLIEHLSDGPATIFGTSSGAIIALEVLARHPSVVRQVLPYEPPAMRLLPDGQEWVDFFHGLYDLYQESGVEPALEEFRERAFARSDRQVMARALSAGNSEYAVANAAYWFEHELRQYPAAQLDLPALEAYADRIVPIGGRESVGYPCYDVTLELGKRLGRDVVHLPGGHVGFLTQPAEFAADLFPLIPEDRTPS